MVTLNDKLPKLVHYVVARTRPSELGATKLNKVLWFADLTHYRRYGHTMSGAGSYQKLQHGPVPNEIVHTVRLLKDAGRIGIRYSDTPAGQRREFVWLEQPSLDAFEAEEIDVLNEAIDWVCGNHSAASISALTHDALWQEIELADQIPVGAAAIVSEDVSEDDIEWAASIVNAN